MANNPVLQDRVGRHPLHPFLVHFPIGLWVGSLLFDILYFATHNSGFAIAAFYTLSFGIITALFAAVSGALEIQYVPRESRVRGIAFAHMALNLVVTILFVVNYMIRKFSGQGGIEIVPVSGLVLTIVAITILGFSGYLGGKMVYQYGMGMHPDARKSPPASSERRSA